MLDQYKRNISYLRISVTDRCNLRCTYCMPEEGIELMHHNDILSFEDIHNIVKKAVKEGITKVRLTGGEPLVRKNIVELVSMISSIPEITDLSMTTNGILLDKYAESLAKAGLDRVNISLDTISADKYKKITRGGDINKVFDGIEAAKMAGLNPIKINCVIFSNENEKDAVEVAEYCKNNNLELRYIHQMNLQTGEFSIVKGGNGGDCANCNRMRLTANGEFKPCLFSDISYKVKNENIFEALCQAVESKPLEGSKNMSGNFYNIGG